MANNTILNQTRNDDIMFISFLVKLTELIVIIFTTCYIFCVCWMILCEFIEDYILDTNFAKYGHEELYSGNYFYTFYDFHKTDPLEVTLSNFYFAFTSLTTVGFGDFHPVSE